MIVFKKDNPSGLKEFDDSLSRAVIFVPSEASTTSVGAILGE
jgi:accessory colonization factor AcfC